MPQTKKNGCTTQPNTTATQKKRLNCLTSILGGKPPHCSWQTLVELMFSGDKGLADGLFAEAEHAAMSPNLVHEGLEHHPFLHVTLLVLQLILLLLCICGFQCLSLHSWTHPPLALATPLWALDSSHTHSQFGGGPIWQGRAHAHRNTADSQKTGCDAGFFPPDYSHDAFGSCFVMVISFLYGIWASTGQKQRARRRKQEKKWQKTMTFVNI